MNVCKTWWICNDCVGYKWSREVRWVFSSVLQPIFDCLISSLNTRSITGFDTRSPAALNHLSNLFSPLAYVSTPQCIESRHETWILDHECHKFGWVTANVEEFKAILFDEAFEVLMCRQSHTM